MAADEEQRDERTSLGGAPESGGVSDDKDELHRRCDAERETLTPKETADCAGAEIADLYENEEDGGS